MNLSTEILEEWKCLLCLDYAVNIMLTTCCNGVICKSHIPDFADKDCPMCRSKKYKWICIPKPAKNVLDKIPEYVQYEKKVLEECFTPEKLTKLGLDNLKIGPSHFQTKKSENILCKVMGELLKQCFVGKTAQTCEIWDAVEIFLVKIAFFKNFGGSHTYFSSPEDSSHLSITFRLPQQILCEIFLHCSETKLQEMSLNSTTLFQKNFEKVPNNIRDAFRVYATLDEDE